MSIASKSPKRRVAAIVATAALAVGLIGPAGANEEEPDPEFVTEQDWFQCDGTTKVAQANLVVDNAIPGWDTTAPTESVQDGAGCGMAEAAALSGTAQGSLYDATWEGTFTGNLQDVLMDLHFIQPAAAAYGDIALDLRIAVNGVEYDLGEQFVDGAYTQASDTGASYSMQFAINDFDLIDDYYGPGTKVNTFTITAMGHFIDSGFAVPFVWGTTEVPAGLTFNADTRGLPGVSV